MALLVGLASSLRAQDPEHSPWEGYALKGSGRFPGELAELRTFAETLPPPDLDAMLEQLAPIPTLAELLSSDPRLSNPGWGVPEEVQRPWLDFRRALARALADERAADALQLAESFAAALREHHGPEDAGTLEAERIRDALHGMVQHGEDARSDLAWARQLVEESQRFEKDFRLLDALGPATEALRLRWATLGTSLDPTLESLIQCGRLAIRLGAYDHGLALCFEALRTGLRGFNPRIRIDALGALHNGVLLGLIDARAEAFAREGLRLARAGYGTDSSTAAAWEMTLGSSLEYVDPRAAEGFLQHACAVLRESDDPRLPAALSELGLVLGNHGSYERAEPALLEALERLAQREEEPGLIELNSLRCLAMLRMWIGDVSGAEFLCRRLKRALAAGRWADDELRISECQITVGAILAELGELEESQESLQEAVRIRRRVYGTRSVQLVPALKALGAVSLRRADLDAARSYFEEVLELSSESSPLDRAFALTYLGDIAAQRGQVALARERLEASLAYHARVPETWSHVASLASLGRLERAAGETRRAEELLRQAFALALVIRRRAPGTEQIASAFESTLDLGGLAAELAGIDVRAGRCTQALDELEQGRSRALLDLLERSRRPPELALREADPEGAARYEAGRAEAEALRAEIDRRTRSGEPASSGSEAVLDELRRKLDEVERRGLAQLHPHASQATAADTEAIRSALGPRDWMLVYSWTPDEVLVVALPPPGATRTQGFVLAHDAQETTQLALEVRGPDAVALERLVPAALVRPVLEAERLVVVPDGPLTGLAFETLIADPDRGVPLLEHGPDVVVAPSGSAYLDRSQRGAPQTRVRAVLLGDPVFERGDGARAANGDLEIVPERPGQAAIEASALRVQEPGPDGDARTPLAPLPGTRIELAAIAGSCARAGVEVVELLGEEAGLTRLEQEATDCRYLHFGTHGIPAEAARPTAAALALTLPEHPSRSDPGVLTLERLLHEWRGRLEGCALVVLSACETEVGVNVGSNRFSLPWGVFCAGAPSVVASLWKVEDGATALLMDRFYANLLGAHDDGREVRERVFATGQAMPTSTALREAKLWLRGLSQAEARARLTALGALVPAATRGGPEPEIGGALPRPEAAERPYADARHWAAFVLVGRPD